VIEKAQRSWGVKRKRTSAADYDSGSRAIKNFHAELLEPINFGKRLKEC
jgi:hypothetical protein